MRVLIASSQTKKSCFEVKGKMWVTVGRVFEVDETGEEGGEGGEAIGKRGF